MPKVSVLMPVYNGEKYIAQAIDSVLAQTFKDFELIIVDDGSVDQSATIVSAYKDARIRFIENNKNTGLIETLNRGLTYCNSKYIARLDCDDISHPDRLNSQVKLFESSHETFLCGTWVKAFGDGREHLWGYPTKHDLIRSRMLFDCPFAHSSVMFRARLLDQSNTLYDKDYPVAEDYELWERISRSRRVSNIPSYLTYYRIHPHQVSKRKANQQTNSIWAIQSRLLQQLQIEPSEEEKTIHLDIGVGWHFEANKERLNLTECWLVKLADANDKSQVFPEVGFRHVLAERWFLANLAAVREGQVSWGRYGKSVLSSWEPLRLRRQARLLWESVRNGK